ncbi:MAG: hypothetical protein Q8J97_11845 [Flavobacteriaceae bacterium]|nr:hypothetical protein [Flavobacteriaceae bacterium]
MAVTDNHKIRALCDACKVPYDDVDEIAKNTSVVEQRYLNNSLQIAVFEYYSPSNDIKVFYTPFAICITFQIDWCGIDEFADEFMKFYAEEFNNNLRNYKIQLGKLIAPLLLALLPAV